MFKVNKKEIELNGKKISLETGKIARQADGAIIARCGETVVMATVVGAKKVNPEVDYFPLSVNYQEKYYSAGKIPGGYFKREARPTESETLISRLIDRPIRPLFPDEFRNEVQLLPTVISYDKENESDILSIIASSAALAISGMPFMGPVGASRVGFIDGKYVLNPSKKELEKSKLDLVVAGTKDAVLMVESEANGLSEEEMLKAVKFGHENFIPIIKMIEDLAKDCKKPDWIIEKKDLSEVKKRLDKEFTAELKKAFSIKDKQERSNLISNITERAKKLYEEDENISELDVNYELKNLEKKIVRTDILKNKKRIDGRGLADVRPIECEVGILPRTHGSALFTRGETQAIVTTTLGTSDDEQRIETLDGLVRQRFMLHYNFPPFSVGETGRIGTGRREIGHGKLAWRAIKSSLPPKESFPYTFRIVSEITESNGSSSMATVCGTSLALMDAGVPIKEPVAGIAMGLIKEGKDFSVLSDILGDEDHLGDMDFKVAGTEKGITALQMDIKIQGITEEIMEIALEQANTARIHILNEMNKVLGASRETVSENAPAMAMIKIDPDKIRDVIGKGGAVIRGITEDTGASVDIDDDGNVRIYGEDADSRDAAVDMVNAITAEAEVGKLYSGKVARIVDFGAFVTILPGKDGLVHISQIAKERVENVNEYLKEGQDILVKCLDLDARGRIKLSIKEITDEEKAGFSEE